MKAYIVSLAAGVLVGVVYSVLHVRSPAPPVIALVGLMGILIGEQLIPVGRAILAGQTWHIACTTRKTMEHVFGELPGRNRDEAAQRAKPEAAT